MRWVAYLALCGCGRFGFEPLPDRASDGPGGPRVCGAFSAPVQLPGPVQSASDDWYPTPANDELELYLYRNVGGAGDAEILRATRASKTDPFSAATVVMELATAENDLSVSLTDDRLYMAFARGEPRQLFHAERTSTALPFGNGTAIAELAGVSVYAPWLSPDGTRMMFAASRNGWSDIFESTRVDRSSPWQSPVDHPTIEGSEHDEDPTLSADGLEIFFASTRPGIGLRDVYRSTRADLAAPFDPPQLVVELSTARDEVGLRLSSDGRTMYLNYDSLRSGGDNAEIWTATRVCTD